MNDQTGIISSGTGGASSDTTNPSPADNLSGAGRAKLRREVLLEARVAVYRVVGPWPYSPDVLVRQDVINAIDSLEEPR